MQSGHQPRSVPPWHPPRQRNTRTDFHATRSRIPLFSVNAFSGARAPFCARDFYPLASDASHPCGFVAASVGAVLPSNSETFS